MHHNRKEKKRRTMKLSESDSLFTFQINLIQLPVPEQCRHYPVIQRPLSFVPLN